MSRPEKRVTLRLPESVYDEIVQLHQKRHTSINQTIVDVLEFGFEVSDVFSIRIVSDCIQAEKKALK